jgi:hypothetical protein
MAGGGLRRSGLRPGVPRIEGAGAGQKSFDLHPPNAGGGDAQHGLITGPCAAGAQAVPRGA